MARTYTEYAYFQTVILSPIVPRDLRLDQIGNTVRLSWLDPSSYEDGFVIQRKNEIGSWQTVYFIDKQKDFFVDYGPFTSGQTYYYRVSSFIILPNQSYLISASGVEVSITMALSSASADAENVVEIEFGQLDSLSVFLSDSMKIYVKDASASVDYLWFVDGNSVVLSGHGDYADLFAIEAGQSEIIVKKSSDSGEARLTVVVVDNNVLENPSPPSNLRANSINDSSVEVLWNYSTDTAISHFDIYRIKRIGSSSKNNLIDFTDLSKNRIGMVAFDSTLGLYSFRDYGLGSGSTYIYTVVAVSKYNKSSLYIQDNTYDYVSNRKYTTALTESAIISINPTLSYVSPGDSLYLGISSANSRSFTNIEWAIEQNNSGSVFRTTDEEVTYFEASDKSISKDDVRVRADSYSATARVIITETM